MRETPDRFTWPVLFPVLSSASTVQPIPVATGLTELARASCAVPGSRLDHSRRSEPDPGLLTIQPDDVLRAADELLARGCQFDDFDKLHSSKGQLDAIGEEGVARRIRVPLGFVATAGFYLYVVAHRTPCYHAIAWSLALVLPGLAIRAIASGTVKKNRELTVTGPYAYTRNPLYLGSTLIAAGFAVALLSWPLALLLAAGFAIIYIPVIASEERFLRSAFPDFDAYCRLVPRFLPRLTAAKLNKLKNIDSGTAPVTSDAPHGFSLELYRKHREYNAALGAALLYLSLFFLRPLLELIQRGAR